MDWKEQLEEWYPKAAELRHFLHERPELAYQEVETTRLVRELLTGYGARVLVESTPHAERDG